MSASDTTRNATGNMRKSPMHHRFLLLFAFAAALCAGLSIAPHAAAATQYVSVPGAAFVADSNATPFTYDGGTCLNSSSGIFRAAINIPSGSVITSITFGHVNKIALVSSTLASFQAVAANGTASTFVVPSSLAQGFNATSLTQNYTVDNANITYQLQWQPNTNGNQSLCYIRIAYTPPQVCTLDVDGNGTMDALTDGLLLIRALFGLTGTAVTNGAVGGGAPTRTTWSQIQTYLNGACGSSFAP